MTLTTIHQAYPSKLQIYKLTKFTQIQPIIKTKEKAHHQIHRSRGHLQLRCHPTSRHHQGRECSQRCCKWIFEDVLIQGNSSSCLYKPVKKLVKDFLSEDWKISLLKIEVKSVLCTDQFIHKWFVPQKTTHLPQPTRKCGAMSDCCSTWSIATWHCI